jgi:UDP-N-acetylmuramate--alanine ligase
MNTALLGKPCSFDSSKLIMNQIKSIHFVGIKGVGMTPLAIIAKEAGINVTGSDIVDEFITDKALQKAGIMPLVGFVEKNVGNVDLVITTGAHGGFNNIEVLEAKKKNIKVMSQGEAVGVFMDGKIFNRKFVGISVTGTHGKTTTSAMIATVLKSVGLDPSFLIGTSDALSLGAPGHYGKGEYFVAEADEYMTEPTYDKTIKHMWQHPKYAVITNIEFDHPDAYKSLDETREKFLAFANQLPKDGVLIACGDDPQVKKLLNEFKGQIITYGINSENDFVVDNVLKNIQLPVFGAHNRLNATAAFAVGEKIGLSKEQIKNGLLQFKGSKRRAEFIGNLSSGAHVFDDYAHHPTEIKKTLKAFREKFPTQKIVCIFQPHTYSRTKSLFEQFSESFRDIDIVILTNIYASLREKPDPSVSMRDLARKIGKKALFMPSLDDVVKYLNAQNFGSNDVMITMGAGDVYKINEKIKLWRR